MLFRSLLVFKTEADVAGLGHKILILSAFFQAFDAVNIISTGALRGAGDTRWMMFMTIIMSYVLFLPLALLFGIIMNGGAIGAWCGAMIFIILLSAVLFHRFYSEVWRGINIFKYSTPEK